MAVERVVCEVCNRSYFRKNSRGKYCSDRCRQFAYENRKRILKRAVGYSLDARQLDDVNAVKKVSAEAASTILKVASIAGKDLAGDVLDAVWDVMINLGYRVEVGV